MVEAVDIVMQIIEVALKIKEAVDTVRENEEDCLRIQRRVERVRQTLLLCKNNAELMKNPSVNAVLEELGDILGKALGLVSDCQERSFVCLYCTAGKRSKQLSKVDQGILNLYLEATLTILSYQMSKQNQDDAHPPPVPASPEAGRADEQYSFDAESPRRRRRRRPQPARLHGIDPDAAMYIERVRRRMTKDKPESPHVVPSCTPSVYAVPVERPQKLSDRPLGGVMADQQQQRSLLQEIGQAALEIKEAVQTVRQNKQECIEIDKRANRVSDLLSRFENTETMKDPAMSAQLEKLLETFRHARTLVTACQRRNITSVWPAGKLSKQLREVLDQMVLALHDMIAISAGRACTV